MNEKEKKNKALTIILWSTFCFIVLPLFIISAIFAVQGNTNKKTVPSIFGYMPMIITSGSMEPKIHVGDIIFSKNIDVDMVNDGDIISYWDPTNPNKIVTHIVLKSYEKNGIKYFDTYGLFTGSTDTVAVPEQNFVGVYVGKIPLIGNIALFAQTPLGLVIFLLIPLGAVLIYDTIRKNKKEEQKEEEIKLLKEEIKKLKNEK